MLKTETESKKTPESGAPVRRQPEHPESRTRILPGQHKYLFVYPFVKTREWYLQSIEERQKAMDTHIKVGVKFPSVKLNTTYSFGIDDHDFVLAFETDDLSDFQELMIKLRSTEASKYVVKDTPMIVSKFENMETIFDSLVG